MLRRLGALVASSLLFACTRSEAPKSSPTPVATPTPTPIATPTPTSIAPAPPPLVDVDALPWQTGDGFGIARKDTKNASGENIFIAYAGWRVSLASAQKWATALYRESLEKRGVRWIWAVQGPSDPMYRKTEIGNDELARALVPIVSPKTPAQTGTLRAPWVLVVAHSSGAFVANELFALLAHGADPTDATRERIVYFNLDGGEAGLDAAIVDRLRRAYFVGAFDSIIATPSHEDDDMRAAGASYAEAGGYMQHRATGSGCKRGATWCVHMTLVTSKPHDPADAKEIDFADFEGREVTHAYLEEKAIEAGLE